MNYYKLDDNKKVIPISKAEHYAMDDKESIKHIKHTQLKKYNARISTIFMFLDHGWPSNPLKPVAFETMVFWEGNELDNYQLRYADYADAVQGHRETVRMVIKAIRKSKDLQKQYKCTNHEYSMDCMNCVKIIVAQRNKLIEFIEEIIADWECDPRHAVALLKEIGHE